MNPTNILVLYFSRHGHVRQLASYVTQGIYSVENCEPVLARIPDVNDQSDGGRELIASPSLLHECHGLVLGMPSWFGGVPAAVKHFWDQTTSQWLNGALVDKPAALFCSTNSMHGGHEAVLLNAMVPLLHHGMIIVGNPYTEKSLNSTQKGGSPYGAGHVETSSNVEVGSDKTLCIDAQERLLALSLGERVATIANKMSS